MGPKRRLLLASRTKRHKWRTLALMRPPYSGDMHMAFIPALRDLFNR